MIESAVSGELSEFFRSRQLEPLGKLNAFDHEDDATERSFEIDLAIGPHGTKGNRTSQQAQQDRALFESQSELIDGVIEDLITVSLFPNNRTSNQSWMMAANPNPLFGIAIEIENNLSKYFLGSLLAAAIAGRWGILLAPKPPGCGKMDFHYR